jgi:hypothetical protein
MNLTTIDIAGTIEQLMKWVLKEIVLFLTVVIVGLSAPLLFTVGPLWLAWRYPGYASTWAVIYLLVGRFACTFWMIIIRHWPAIQWARRAGRLRTWREDNGGYVRTMGKSLWFMVSGFFGPAVAEGFLTYAAHRMSVIPENLMLFFAVAPFAVFAPVLLVLLSRWIRRDEYATA